jgi:phosphate starvation-inducible PhoH-like protein
VKKDAQRVMHVSLDLNNSDLSSLVGPLDCNIAQLENGLNVEISRRASSFEIKGEEGAVQRASKALMDLGKMAAGSSSDISAEDIQLYLAEDPLQPEMPAEEPTPELQTRRKGLQGRTPAQRRYIRNIFGHDISFGVGPAGTGKTYLAVAAAVDAYEKGAVERIVLTRPAVEAGEKLGFLPGDLSQKVDPYLRPLYDALFDLLGADRTQRLLEKQHIEIAPLAYMRGRTLNSSFVILDEAQNTTPEQMKMFLTRIGFGSKAVITGDATQVDLPRGQKSGLLEAAYILRDVRGISITYFTAADVVRHPLVARIVEAYEKAGKANEEGHQK